MLNEADKDDEIDWDESGRWDTSDNVHGYIELDYVCKRVIDTPAFQRLRGLEQLGLTSKVFAPATHTRFIHSLGVAHLARWYTKDILREGCNQHRESRINDRDILLVQLSGLTHDLGHGPYSHVFENVLLPRLNPGGERWHHEGMSAMLIDHVMGEFDLEDYGLLNTDKEIIKALVLGDPSELALGHDYRTEKRFLFDIVANKRTGIDVDRLDYLLRDSRMTGVKIVTDATRLLNRSRLMRGPEGWEICFKGSEYASVHNFFKDRATMHARVYTHKRVKAVEVMVADALAEVDSHLRISQSIHTVQDFLTLDDSLISRAKALPDDESAAVRKAKALLERVDRRQLYTLVGQVVVPHDPSLKVQQKVPTAAEIVSFQKGDGLNTLREDDVVVCYSTIDHGMSTANPMDNVHFYAEGERERAGTRGRRSKCYHRVQIDPQAVSSFLNPLQTYQERSIRVFCRDDNPRKLANVEVALQLLCKERGVQKCLTTPSRPRLPDKRPLGDAAGHQDGVNKRLHYEQQ